MNVILRRYLIFEKMYYYNANDSLNMPQLLLTSKMLVIKKYNLLSFPGSRPPMVWKEVGEKRPERRNFKLIWLVLRHHCCIYGSAGAAEANRRWKYD